MSEIELSIIVPYYNLVKYLPKLLSTIPNNPQVEAIIIDDHSTMGIPEYKQLQKTFSGRNIRFIQNDPGCKGIASARKKGISEARGTFLFFADADDYLSDDMWEVVSPYLNDDYDMVLFNRDKALEDDVAIDRVEYYSKTISEIAASDSDDALLFARFKVYSMCGRIIRKSYMQDTPIEFTPVMYCEDSVCSILCGYYIPKVQVVDKVIYHVLRRNGSNSMIEIPEKVHTCNKMMLFTYFFIERKFGISMLRKLKIARRCIITNRLKMLKINLYELRHGKIYYPSKKDVSDKHYPFL